MSENEKESLSFKCGILKVWFLILSTFMLGWLCGSGLINETFHVLIDSYYMYDEAPRVLPPMSPVQRENYDLPSPLPEEHSLVVPTPKEA